MKLIRILRSTALLLAIVLLNSVSLASHASAMPVMSHEMGGMSHGSSDSTSCATLCRSAVFNQEETINSRTDEEDDEPVVPFYVQNQVGYFSDTLVSQKLYADSVKPPPKIPIYIQLQVFRI